MADVTNINELIKEKEFLIIYVLKRWFPKHLFDEDFVQIGRVALWRAIKTYDDSKGAKLDTYAITCIRRAISSELVRLTRKTFDINNEVYCFDDMTFTTLKGEDATPFKELLPDEKINIESIVIVNDMIDSLTEEERKIVAAKLNKIGEGRLEKEYGISKSVSRRIWEKIRKKFRDEFGED